MKLKYSIAISILLSGIIGGTMGILVYKLTNNVFPVILSIVVSMFSLFFWIIIIHGLTNKLYKIHKELKAIIPALICTLIAVYSWMLYRVVVAIAFDISLIIGIISFVSTLGAFIIPLIADFYSRKNWKK